MNPEPRRILACLLSVFISVGLSACRDSTPEPKPEPRSEWPATLHVEGTLRHVSPIPDPAANNYKDCLFTAVFEVNGVQTGNIPERVVLVMPAFLERKMTVQSELKSGQGLSALVCRFDEIGRPFANMQQADTIEDIGMPLYFSDQIEVVDSFRAWNKPSAAAEMSVASVSAVSASAAYRPSAAQREAIAASIQRIHERRDAHGGWEAWDKELAPVVRQITAATKENPLPIFDEPFSLRSLRGLSTRFDPDHPGHPERLRTVQALVQLRDGLALGGTELVLAPVPDRDLVGLDQMYAGIRPADGIWNPHRLRRNLQLLEHGIEVLDTTEAMRAAASASRSASGSGASDKGPIFFFESHDGHPGGGAVHVLGEAITARLMKSDELTPLSAPTPGIALEWHAIESPPPYAHAPFLLQHQYPVLTQGQVQHPDNPDSPILLFGDSFLKNPDGGGVSDVVGSLLGHVPDLFIRTSGAVEMPRHLARSRAHLTGKTVAVMVFKEALLDPHHESWALVDFGKGQSDYERYVRLSASGQVLLKYNSQADFALLAPREKPPGFFADSRRAYIPPATNRALHVDCLPRTYRGDRNYLIFMRLRTRHSQHMDVVLDDKVVRSVPLTHHDNELHLLIDPDGTNSQLSFRLPQGGGNLFIESLLVFESSVRE